MVKLLGSLLVLGGGGLACFLRMGERRKRRRLLSDLTRALRRMGEEIRMARTPLPRLLESLAGDCGQEAADLLRETAEAAAAGENLEAVWRSHVEKLPLEERDRTALRGLELRGDEENICKGIQLVTYGLTERLEELERRREEEDKRTAALCFSGAALVVILLI